LKAEAMSSYPPPQPYVAGHAPHRAQTRQFAFDGGAGTYFGTAILGFFITLLTLGICYPFALVLRERWRAKHSFIDGRQLAFNGSAWGLFGLWIKWFLLIIVTIGIYSFWVGPRIARWKWENTSWAQQIPAGWGAPVRY
jgi:uncharacterized membrane protein YjgN (DUF898 family)